MVATSEVERYRALADRAISDCPDYPDTFNGRGIVICGGGVKYFTCAWVCIMMLRKFKCFLPIEVWYLGPDEMSEDMEDLMSSLGVECVDAFKVREQHPIRRLAGWELNPFSIIHSKFREVLFLDADNVVTRNPEYLFDSAQYEETGAIFWPDYGRLAPDRDIWQIVNTPHRDEPEFESGQIIIDKKRCWEALNLTMHYNEYSDFYYQHVHGDKETYHMAWRRLGQEYSMPPYPIHNLANKVMCQHDFDGSVIFQHRNLAKWQYKVSDNIRIKDFRHEATCLKFLTILQELWSGRVEERREETRKITEFREKIVNEQYFLYNRVGKDRRRMRLAAGGKITEGQARLEDEWDVLEEDGKLQLCILGQEGIICRLVQGKDKVFRGQWVSHERCKIELTPLSAYTRRVKV